jgi:predicted dehydrogenase
MPENKVNVALVGCGLFGEVHAATLANFDEANLVAVCDSNLERAEDFAERFGCRACASVAEIADDEDIEAVSVVTPDCDHKDVCIELARAGKHLLIEKPLATSVEDAEAVALAVDEAGVTAMVDFHNRYHPAVLAIKGRLDRGEMGRPQVMYARLSDRIEVPTEWLGWAGRSGPQWFLGPHLVDLACWLFGKRPRRIFADARKDVLAARGIDCYDSLQMHLSFDDGLATLETSWIVPNAWPCVADFYLSLQATDARADIDMSNQGATIVDDGRYDRPFLFGHTPAGRDDFGFMSYPIRDFVRAVQSGEPAPIPFDDGLDNVRLIAAALESIQTGKVVDVEQ